MQQPVAMLGPCFSNNLNMSMSKATQSSARVDRTVRNKAGQARRGACETTEGCKRRLLLRRWRLQQSRCSGRNSHWQPAVQCDRPSCAGLEGAGAPPQTRAACAPTASPPLARRPANQGACLLHTMFLLSACTLMIQGETLYRAQVHRGMGNTVGFKRGVAPSCEWRSCSLAARQSPSRPRGLPSPAAFPFLGCSWPCPPGARTSFATCAYAMIWISNQRPVPL